MKHYQTIFTFIVLLIATTAYGQNQSPQVIFESLYGEEARRAASTRDTDDDVALAAKLVAAAEASLEQLPVLAYFSEKAYEFGSKHPDGYGSAIAAMELVRDNVDIRERQARNRILDLRQKRYDRAAAIDKSVFGADLIAAYMEVGEDFIKQNDLTNAALNYVRAQRIANDLNSPAKTDIADALETIRDRQQLNRRIEMYERQLETDPQNTRAHEELYKIYMIELNNAHQARKYATLGADETGRRLIGEITSNWRRVDPPLLIDIGDYYRELSRNLSSRDNTRNMLRRAKVYYERFLERYSTEDLLRVKASLALREVDQAILELDIEDMKTAGLAGQWVDLLKLADPARHAVAGKWHMREDGSLTRINAPGFGGQAYFALPISPAGSYELEVKFLRAAGRGGVALLLPVAEQRVMFVLGGRGGAVGGLHRIEGREYGDRQNPTRQRPSIIRNGRLTTILAKVTVDGAQATIEITIDGRPHLNWTGPKAHLSTEAVYPDNLVGIATSNEELPFRAARIRGVNAPVKFVEVRYPEPKPSGG